MTSCVETQQTQIRPDFCFEVVEYVGLGQRVLSVTQFAKLTAPNVLHCIKVKVNVRGFI